MVKNKLSEHKIRRYMEEGLDYEQIAIKERMNTLTVKSRMRDLNIKYLRCDLCNNYIPFEELHGNIPKHRVEEARIVFHFCSEQHKEDWLRGDSHD